MAVQFPALEFGSQVGSNNKAFFGSKMEAAPDQRKFERLITQGSLWHRHVGSHDGFYGDLSLNTSAVKPRPARFSERGDPPGNLTVLFAASPFLKAPRNAARTSSRIQISCAYCPHELRHLRTSRRSRQSAKMLFFCGTGRTSKNLLIGVG
jgi:hypothetical protein